MLIKSLYNSLGLFMFSDAVPGVLPQGFEVPDHERGAFAAVVAIALRAGGEQLEHVMTYVSFAFHCQSSICKRRLCCCSFSGGVQHVP